MNCPIRIINESTQIQLKPKLRMLKTDDKNKLQDMVIIEIMKKLSPKYAGMDYSDIERSHGDISKFKYYGDIQQTISLLMSLNLPNEVRKYVVAADIVRRELFNNREMFSLYVGKEDLMGSLLYTTAMTSLVYGLSYLVSECVKFEEHDNMDVVKVEYSKNIDENIHLKSLMTLSDIFKSGDLNKLFNSVHKNNLKETEKIVEAEMKAVFDEATSLNENFITSTLTVTGSVITGSGVLPLMAVALVLTPLLVWKLVPTVRAVLYSVYYLRVKIDEAMGIQASLIETNIQALENRNFDKKVIARQRKVVKMLQGVQSVFALKVDESDIKALNAIKSDDRSIGITTRESEHNDSGLMV